MGSTLHAPHQHINVRNEKERFLIELFDTLWERYRGRMEYVRMYENLIAQHKATFVNDHIAFRTVACQNPMLGIFMISRIFEALGYSMANCYEFPDKHFSSIHFEHPNPQFPKLFITQLKTWELSARAQTIIHQSIAVHRAPLADETVGALFGLQVAAAGARAELLKTLVRYFAELPWPLPKKEDVLELDKESQFAAWVLVNGYDVNHFTASVNSHGVPTLDDVEKVQAAMIGAGIPMKKEIEGERGSKFRQTSTEAVIVPVKVKEGAKTAEIPWTYAYFEIADRPPYKDPVTGKMARFEGFLGAQATNLFDMTKLKK
jgi:2-oxoadipate dioxygenase/decarboxylase-like protein